MRDKIAPTAFGPLVEAASHQAASGQHKHLTTRDIKRWWLPRFAKEELDELVIPKRTFARRLARAEPLSADETDRAIRLARIQANADRVFASPEKASRWLRTGQQRLTGQTPLAVLKTEAGAALVAEMLVQIDHGMFA